MEVNASRHQSNASFIKVRLYVQAVDSTISYANAKPRRAWLALGMHLYWIDCAPEHQTESIPDRLRDFRFHNRLYLHRLKPDGSQEDISRTVNVTTIEDRHYAIIAQGNLIPRHTCGRDGPHFLRGLLCGMCSKSTRTKQGLVELVIVFDSLQQRDLWKSEIRKRIVPWQYLARSMRNLELTRQNMNSDPVEPGLDLETARSKLKSTLDIDLRHTLSLKCSKRIPHPDIETGEIEQHNHSVMPEHSKYLHCEVCKKDLAPPRVIGLFEELELNIKILATILAITGSITALVLRGRPGLNFPYFETLVGAVAVYQIFVLAARLLSMAYEIRRGKRNFKGLISKIELFHDELFSTLCAMVDSPSEVESFQCRNTLEVREETLKLAEKIEMFLMRADTREYYEMPFLGLILSLMRMRWQQHLSSWKDVQEVEYATMILQDKVALVSQVKLIFKACKQYTSTQD